MDRQGLKSAAELSTLLTLMARGVDVLCLNVEVKVGALHHNMAYGALPVRALQPQHHGSDLCTEELSHNSEQSNLKKRIQEQGISDSEGCQTRKGKRLSLFLLSVYFIDVESHNCLTALKATQSATPGPFATPRPHSACWHHLHVLTDKGTSCTEQG